MARFPLAMFLLAACGPAADPDWTVSFGDPGSQYTGPDGIYRGPTLVDQVWLDCMPDPAAWHYTVYTYGWALDATVRVHRWYPDDLENHHLVLGERGDDYQWERRDAVLPIVDEGMGVADQSTELDCDFTFFTWRIGVTDLEGEESDCVVFGYDTDGLDPNGRCREMVLSGE